MRLQFYNKSNNCYIFDPGANLLQSRPTQSTQPAQYYICINNITIFLVDVTLCLELRLPCRKTSKLGKLISFNIFF